MKLSREFKDEQQARTGASASGYGLPRVAELQR